MPHEHTHIWTVEVVAGPRSRQLTDHPVSDELFAAWSPDGSQIIFVSNRSQNSAPDIDLNDIDIMLGTGGDFKRMNTPPGPKSHPVISPDGRWIAYFSVEGINEGFKNNSLWVLPADGSPPARNLTETYDLHVDSFIPNDTMTPEFISPTWSFIMRMITAAQLNWVSRSLLPSSACGWITSSCASRKNFTVLRAPAAQTALSPA